MPSSTTMVAPSSETWPMVRVHQPDRTCGSGCTSAIWPEDAGSERTVAMPSPPLGKLDRHDAGAVGEQRSAAGPRPGCRRASPARYRAADGPPGRCRPALTSIRLRLLRQCAWRHVLRQTRRAGPRRAARSAGAGAGPSFAAEREAMMSMSLMASNSVSLRPSRIWTHALPAKRDEEEDQESRNRQPQQGLILLEPPICRVRVRPRHP